jgi:hypothetical protein
MLEPVLQLKKSKLNFGILWTDNTIHIHIPLLQRIELQVDFLCSLYFQINTLHSPHTQTTQQHLHIYNYDDTISCHGQACLENLNLQ